MRKVIIVIVMMSLGVFLSKELLIKNLTVDDSIILNIHIQQCPGNTYTIERLIPKGACLKIQNSRVAVPELNVYHTQGYYLYGPIALNVCAFSIDTLK